MSIRELLEQITNKTYDLVTREDNPRPRTSGVRVDFQEEAPGRRVPSAEELIFKVSSGR
jgi:hypothetical protein